MRSKFLTVSVVVMSLLLVPSAAWAADLFAPKVDYGTGDSPWSVAVGDFDGDGDSDLATANFFADSVSVLLGAGDGSFAAKVDYGVDNGPQSVAAGDFDGDGNLDLAATNKGSATVSVLLGAGDGSFAAKVDYGTGTNPVSVAVGDFDGDGDLDLVVGNIGSASLSVLLGAGDGTFATKVDYVTGLGAYSIAVGDLDGDGDLDLATANAGSDSLSVLLGAGDGTFANKVDYYPGPAPQSVTVGDFDGDGDLDLAAANSTGSSTVGVLLGAGNGTFANKVDYGTGGAPWSVAAGDFDGDGNLDLATANQGSASVSVLVGVGDGTFAPKVDHGTGLNPFSVAADDFDGDGDLDLATANVTSDSVSVLLNKTITAFVAGPTATISGTVRQGQTLTADEGSPDPTPDPPFTYEWFADGVSIGGATAKTFELTSAQVGKKIKVTVTAHKTGYDDASDTSAETVPVVGIFTPGPTATISGFARIGSTLTARAGSPSPTPTSLAYRWYADGVKLSQVNKTFKPTSSHHGKRITVRVYALKAGYLTASDLSPATARVSSLQAKTISMELNDYTVRRGQVVRAEIERLASGEPFSIVLDGKKLTSGTANTKGIAVKYFTIPANATRGERILRAYGKFPDRTDPDKITIS